MPDHLLIIMSNPTPGHEDEYSRWYEKHLAETVDTHPAFCRAAGSSRRSCPAGQLTRMGTLPSTRRMSTSSSAAATDTRPRGMGTRRSRRCRP